MNTLSTILSIAQGLLFISFLTAVMLLIKEQLTFKSK